MSYNNKEKQRQYQREWVARRRSAYFADKNCSVDGCTETDLELDHIDPTTKKYNPAVLWGMSDKNPKKIEELAKCQVLCKVHHLEKSIGEHSAVGERHGAANLTEIQVLQVREMYARGARQIEISQALKIHKSTVHNIVSRKTWKHI